MNLEQKVKELIDKIESERQLGSEKTREMCEFTSVSALGTTLPKIGRYQCLSQLGEGGFGRVYLAEDPELHRSVAIKIPRLDKIGKNHELRNFVKEGRMLAQVEHPAIVNVFDIAESDDGVPFVVLQYIEGVTLRELVRSSKLQPSECIDLLLQVAVGLQASHEASLIHRDIKLENIIVDGNCKVHIVDFGLALHEELEPIESGKRQAGTPSYMSPEQIKGEHHLVDGRTDIWSFGVTMYCMLVGKRPFSSKTDRGLVEAICFHNPKPLRQHDSSIDRQLERICLKCLEKLIADRYASFADIIEELEAYMDDQAKSSFDDASATQVNSSPESELITKRDSKSLDTDSGNISSVKSNSVKSESIAAESLEIVPKGLRSYDENDSEFFMGLLPGPRDRHGIPDSIRFWQSVIEQEANQDVPVGLIYGPSGSGKSSFIRAGLIPNLSPNVIPIYVDCTNESLIDVIPRKMGREIGSLPRELSFLDIIRFIRHGEFLARNQKVLLVLDQFEQWLLRCSNYLSDDLTQALRHCDADRFQTICLIRDDFWVEASQFMKAIEQKIEESKNAMALPLLDTRHARNLLISYGKSIGCISQGELAKQQERFAKEAIEEISDYHKVICVRLIVLCEVFKNRDWTVSEIQKIGGWDGIGREFVGSIFRDAPKVISQNDRIAWKILQPLLSNETPEIKGHGLTKQDLLNKTELSRHRGRFNLLFEFLAEDAGLISPLSDDIDEQLESEGNSDRKTELVYGLTHDFLVEPIRSWGEAVENREMKGRVASGFAKSAKHWKITRENKMVPGLISFLSFIRRIPVEVRQENEEFWSRIKRKTMIQFALLTICLLAMGAGYLGLRSYQHQQDANRFVERTVTSWIIQDKDFWKDLERYGAVAKKKLIAETKSEDPFRVRRATGALAYLNGTDEHDYFSASIQNIQNYRNHDFEFALMPLKKHETVARTKLFENYESLDDLGKVRAAILAVHLGDKRLINKTAKLGRNPDQRTMLIDQLRYWHGDVLALIDQLNDTGVDTLSSFLCGFSLMNSEEISQEWRSKIIGFANSHLDSRYASVKFSAEHLLENWKCWNREKDFKNHPNANWCILKVPDVPENSSRLEMIKISSGRYVPGAGVPKQIPLPRFGTGIVKEEFFVSVFEISQELYDVSVGDFEPDAGRLNLPATNISWKQAASFCNWLSKQMDLKPRYVIENESITFVENSNGFRMPNCDEFEFAMRAKSASGYLWGSSARFSKLFISTSFQVPVARGLKIPNGFGLSDICGNVREWCNDGIVPGYPHLKGGGFDSTKQEYLSSYYQQRPDFAVGNSFGIRVVIESRHLQE